MTAPQPAPRQTARAEKRPGMVHIGWWSERNGFTPTRGKDAEKVARFMRWHRGDKPVYITAADKADVAADQARRDAGVGS